MLEHFRVCPGSDFSAPYYVPPDGGAGSSGTRRDSIASSGTTIGAPKGSGADAATLPMSGGASTSAGWTLSPAGTSAAGRSTLAMAAAVAAVIPLPSDDDEGCGPVQLRPHQGAGHSQDPKPHGAGCAQAQTPQSPKPSDGEGSGLVSQPLLSAEGTSEAVLESLLKQRKTLPVMRESAVLWKVWMRRGEVWKVWIKECIHRRRESAVLWKVSLAAHVCHVCTMPCA